MYLTQTVQSTCAELDRSLRQRTDGELCILRLCDESLSGDVVALEARIAKLEESLKNGVPTVKSAAPKVSRPEPRRYDDVPPLPEEEPPLPEAPPPSQPIPVYEAPKPAPKAAVPAAGGDSSVWQKLTEHYKGRLPVNQRVFLNMVSGTLDGDCLRVCCPNDFIKSSVDSPAILGVLKEVTEQEVGHSIRVELVVGDAPKHSAPKAPPARETAPQPVEEPGTPAHDAFADLMNKGKNLQNFTIKGE